MRLLEASWVGCRLEPPSRSHIQAEHKARFQNSRFYFKRGIAVPMVSSTRVSASVMEDAVFDQSIVGVFPHESSLFHYLLGFFNSPTCTTLLRTLNPSANNSANYLKKLPILLPCDGRRLTIGSMVEKAITSRRQCGADKKVEEEIEQHLPKIYRVLANTTDNGLSHAGWRLQLVL